LDLILGLTLKSEIFGFFVKKFFGQGKDDPEICFGIMARQISSNPHFSFLSTA